jgi:endonuclease VIII-like 1
MPELAELKIMADYINQNVKDKVFNKSFHVLKGNNPEQFQLLDEFKVNAESFGKELIIRLYSGDDIHKISVFMGMSGNWKWVKTENWNETKYIRMRLDSEDGWSLLLYGSYMGPKYKIGGFTGLKRGPDPTKHFSDFYENIKKNLHRSVFDKPICEVILNQQYFNGIGAYLCSEIIGRLDVDPFEDARSVIKNYPKILSMCRDVSIESYNLGGGELMDWENPFGQSKISDWIKFYGKKDICCKQKFGKRNIWIQKKWIQQLKIKEI